MGVRACGPNRTLNLHRGSDQTSRAFELIVVDDLPARKQQVLDAAKEYGLDGKLSTLVLHPPPALSTPHSHHPATSPQYWLDGKLSPVSKPSCPPVVSANGSTLHVASSHVVWATGPRAHDRRTAVKANIVQRSLQHPIYTLRPTRNVQHARCNVRTPNTGLQARSSSS